MGTLFSSEQYSQYSVGTYNTPSRNIKKQTAKAMKYVGGKSGGSSAGMFGETFETYRGGSSGGVVSSMRRGERYGSSGGVTASRKHKGW